MRFVTDKAAFGAENGAHHWLEAGKESLLDLDCLVRAGHAGHAGGLPGPDARRGFVSAGSARAAL